MYKVCNDCGAHLDPQERCDCKGTFERMFEREYIYEFAKAKFERNLPTCIADDIASAAATKRAEDGLKRR